MKLNRSELQSGFNNKLFEIAIEDFQFDDLEFSENSIKIQISSEEIDNDIRIKGQLSLPLLTTCDRCLKRFKIMVEVPFEFLLSSSASKNKNRILDLVLIPESGDVIDLKPTLRELVYIEQSMKNICTDSCQGLCHICGNNLNVKQCRCIEKKHDSPLDVLKNMVR